MGRAIVTATDGLLLHREPDVHSTRLELMPCGDEVRVITRGHGHFWFVGWQSPKLGWLQGYAWNSYLKELESHDMPVPHPIEPRPRPPAPLMPLRDAVSVAFCLAVLILLILWWLPY